MYLTQDMEPTEQSAASKQVEMLGKLVTARFETDKDFTIKDFTIFDTLPDEDKPLNKYYFNE